jgi:hypothetical protein
MKPKPTVPAVPRSNRTQAPHPPSQGRPPIKDVNVRVFDAHPRRVTVQVVLDLDPRLVRLIADDLDTFFVNELNDGALDQIQEQDREDATELGSCISALSP